MKRIGVITNPTAGSGRGKSWGQEALSLLAAQGYQIQDLSRGSWMSSYEAAVKFRRELDALVVVGGDGMVHLGVQVCANRKLPLGIIAAGSGNDAALSLGLPIHNVPAAVARIKAGLAGAVTRIDLGKVSGRALEGSSRTRYFIAVLSGGIDAAVADRGSRMRFPRGPLKYKAAIVRVLPRFKPYGLRITVDGQQWSQACTLIAVANTPVFGGGLRISPSSKVADGSLEVVIAEPLRRLAIMRLFPKLLRGTHVQDRRVRVLPAHEVELAPDAIGAPLPTVFADGELVGSVPMRIAVAPRALRVLGIGADV